MTTIWQLWHMRNMWVFEKKRLDPLLACNRAADLVGEYEAATRRDHGPQLPGIANDAVKWTPPTAAPFKVNTDAAITNSKVSMGMVVRDNVGDVLISAGMNYCGSPCALLAEAEAARFGLRYAFEAGFRCVEFESDSSSLVKLLKQEARERSAVQVVVDDILFLIRNFDFCSFGFARRICNRVAHHIAQHSLLLNDLVVWMEDFPLDVLPFVNADKASLNE